MRYRYGILGTTPLQTLTYSKSKQFGRFACPLKAKKVKLTVIYEKRHNFCFYSKKKQFGTTPYSKSKQLGGLRLTLRVSSLELRRPLRANIIKRTIFYEKRA